MSRYLRRATAGLLVACALATNAPAFAEDDVDAARKAFVDAYADEKAGRYAEALAKLTEVRRVRDTASVRYRIGACEEALGHFVEARESYLAVEAVARTDDREVVASAKAKAQELESRIGGLSLRIEGASVGRARVDGREIPLRDGAASLFLVPGQHQVAYAPEGEAEAVTSITIEGGKRTILVLDRRGARAVGAPPAPVIEPPPPPARPQATGPSTLGLVSTIAGGALLAVSLVSLALRESAIGTIEDACPDGRCPRAKEQEVEAAKSRAEALMPIAAVTGATGALALGAGVFLLVRPSGASAFAPPSGMTISLGGRW